MSFDEVAAIQAIGPLAGVNPLPENHKITDELAMDARMAMVVELITDLMSQIRHHAISPEKLLQSLQKLFRIIVRMDLQDNSKIKSLLSSLHQLARWHGYTIGNPLMGLELMVVNRASMKNVMGRKFGINSQYPTPATYDITRKIGSSLGRMAGYG